MSQVGMYELRPGLVSVGSGTDNQAIALNTEVTGGFVAGHLTMCGIGFPIFMEPNSWTLSFWLKFDDTSAPVNPDLRLLMCMDTNGSWYEGGYPSGGNEPASARQQHYSWQITHKWLGPGVLQIFFVHPYDSPLPGPAVHVGSDPILLTMSCDYGQHDQNNSRITLFLNGVPGPSVEISYEFGLCLQMASGGMYLLIGASLEDLTTPMQGVIVDAISIVSPANTPARVAEYHSTVYPASAPEYLATPLISTWLLRGFPNTVDYSGIEDPSLVTTSAVTLYYAIPEAVWLALTFNGMQGAVGADASGYVTTMPRFKLNGSDWLVADTAAFLSGPYNYVLFSCGGTPVQGQTNVTVAFDRYELPDNKFIYTMSVGIQSSYPDDASLQAYWLRGPGTFNDYVLEFEDYTFNLPPFTYNQSGPMSPGAPSSSFYPIGLGWPTAPYYQP